MRLFPISLIFRVLDPPLFHESRSAYTAGASARSSVDVNIFSREWMTFWAMSLLGINGRCRSGTTQCIDSHSYSFQMFGIDTPPNAAQMVNRESFWDWSLEQFVRYAMSIGCGVRSVLRIACHDLAVACRLAGCNPFPASSFRIDFKLLKEPVAERSFAHGNRSYYNL